LRLACLLYRTQAGGWKGCVVSVGSGIIPPPGDRRACLLQRDDEGFFLPGQLEAAARRGLEAFVEAMPAPCLVVVPLDASFCASEPDAPSLPPPSDEDAGFALLTQSRSSAHAGRYRDRVAPLLKRPGNPFAQMISVGRAPSNDVVLYLDTVSKLHGYFLEDGTGWRYVDHRSTNGTTIDGRRLRRGEELRLGARHRIRVGLDIAAWLLEPAAVWRRLQQESA
jgi:hypothetical protein